MGVLNKAFGQFQNLIVYYNSDRPLNIVLAIYYIVMQYCNYTGTIYCSLLRELLTAKLWGTADVRTLDMTWCCSCDGLSYSQSASIDDQSYKFFHFRCSMAIHMHGIALHAYVSLTYTLACRFKKFVIHASIDSRWWCIGLPEQPKFSKT